MSIPENITIIFNMELPDIVDRLNEEADILRNGDNGATADELADLFGEAAEEIERLRKKMEGL